MFVVIRSSSHYFVREIAYCHHFCLDGNTNCNLVWFGLVWFGFGARTGPMLSSPLHLHLHRRRLSSSLLSTSGYRFCAAALMR